MAGSLGLLHASAGGAPARYLGAAVTLSDPPKMHLHMRHALFHIAPHIVSHYGTDHVLCHLSVCGRTAIRHKGPTELGSAECRNESLAFSG